MVNKYIVNKCAYAVHSSLQTPGMETQGGLLVRPQLPRGAVFACIFTGIY